MDTVWEIAAYNRAQFSDDGKPYTVQYLFDPPLQLSQSLYPDTQAVTDYLSDHSIPLARSARSLPAQSTPFVLASAD